MNSIKNINFKIKYIFFLWSWRKIKIWAIEYDYDLFFLFLCQNHSLERWNFSKRRKVSQKWCTLEACASWPLFPQKPRTCQFQQIGKFPTSTLTIHQAPILLCHCEFALHLGVPKPTWNGSRIFWPDPLISHS